MKIFILILLLLISCTVVVFSSGDDTNLLAGRRPAVDFFQEEITLSVNDSISRVDGVYHQRNNTDRLINMPMAFPFYVDSVTDFPHEIEVFMKDSLGNKKPLKYKSYPKRKLIRLAVTMNPHSEVTWYLNYEQRIKSKRAVYIITTTAAWSKPLEQGTYTYITPEDFKITKIWPEPDTSFIRDGLTVQQCVKHDFLPRHEMEIAWQ